MNPTTPPDSTTSPAEDVKTSCKQAILDAGFTDPNRQGRNMQLLNNLKGQYKEPEIQAAIAELRQDSQHLVAVLACLDRLN